MSEEAAFSLKFLANGVALELNHAAIGDKAKALREIKEYVALRKVDQVDFSAVEKALGDASASVIIAPPQPEPIDGKVRIRLGSEDSRVEIMVEPPMGKGKKAELKDVMAAIKDAGADKFFLDMDKIENLLTTFRFRDFVPVGEKRDGKFEISVSNDMTEATLTVMPPFGGNPVRLADVLNAIKSEGINYGLKLDNVKKVIAEELYNQSVVIALGEKPADGDDANLQFFFDHTYKRAKPQVGEDGEIDFRELNLFQTVNKGDPVVRKNPATAGIVGKTVTGGEVKPKPGRDIPFPSGLNCTVDPKDPTLVIAAQAGQPKWMNTKVNIVPILEIPGDVDFSTGNINFSGAVNIRGGVMSGFSVKSMGDVQIGGSVEMCTIETGGNLAIRQGIIGQDKSLIICRGNLTAKFADKATIYCDGSVTIDEALIFCKVSCAADVLVAGKKGYIMGGVTRAAKSVTANRIGTPTQTPTLIEVGGSPSLREELENIEKEIAASEEKKDNVSRSLDTAEKLKDAQGNVLSEEQRQRVMLMSRERFGLLSKLRAFKEKKEDLEEKLSRLKSNQLRVNIKEKGMPGAKITIKTANILLYDEVNFTSFIERDGEIEIMPFEG